MIEERSRNVLLVIGGLLAVALVLDWMNRIDAPTKVPAELAVLQAIDAAEAGQRRDQLIAELDRLPVDRLEFYNRWMGVHKADAYECWTENGFDPGMSDLPRDIQLLSAVCYGKADIDNGGFHQFFTNGTGVFAPEMVEWFERSELTAAAKVMRKAIAVFGDEFPRSREERNRFLARYQEQSRSQWDPFYDLDDQFYDCLSHRHGLFDAAANRWLRQQCGIQNLRDDPCVGSDKL